MRQEPFPAPAGRVLEQAAGLSARQPAGRDQRVGGLVMHGAASGRFGQRLQQLGLVRDGERIQQFVQITINDLLQLVER